MEGAEQNKNMPGKKLAPYASLCFAQAGTGHNSLGQERDRGAEKARLVKLANTIDLKSVPYWGYRFKSDSEQRVPKDRRVGLQPSAQ